ncbi:MAG: TauD/TfdA family dioxygenase [Alphaproteobacteria bacterium]|nr:TauD/TfdA family dioxygenase [Alphaproteobacteria bacterium]
MHQITEPSLAGSPYKHAVPVEEPYRHITIDKLTPIIGAEIGGVDLAQPAPEQLQEIHRALAENLVVFFRDQHMTKQQHTDFGRHFGELHLLPAAPSEPGHPALLIVRADRETPRTNGESWHSDGSCDPEPPMGSILCIHECPPVGGDTLFVNMYAAYEALSERMKTYLDGLTALHDGEQHCRGIVAFAGMQDRICYPRAVHPVVRTHPVTGRKALFVNETFTRRILDIPADESAGLLAYLFQHSAHPMFQCRFRWKPNSVAFWDNRCTLHRAISDYWLGRRYGNRVTIMGDRPY